MEKWFHVQTYTTVCKKLIRGRAMTSYDERRDELAINSSILVGVLLGDTPGDMEFVPLRPQPATDAMREELRLRWPGRNLHGAGYIGLVDGAPKLVLKDPLDAVQVEPLDDPPPVPTGTVSLTDSDGNDLGSCTFDSNGNCNFSFNVDMFSVPEDADGDVTISMTATYSGDDNYDAATATFNQVVDCETDEQDTDSYTYSDEEEEDSLGVLYYVTNSTEDQIATTYNCLQNQIGDPDTTEIDSGTQDCTLVGVYALSCDGDGNEIESDLYACSHGDEGTVDEVTGYYYNGLTCDDGDAAPIKNSPNTISQTGTSSISNQDRREHASN
jgi:hypothetical protein